jgi:hypothetical protein
MYTVEAFIPEGTDESYPVWLGNNTLLALHPDFTLTDSNMLLWASFDLTNWFKVSDECESIVIFNVRPLLGITLDPRILLPYPYVKFTLGGQPAGTGGWTMQLSIGDVT